MKVLVADDESSVRHVVSRFLRLDFDAETVEACHGAEALGRLLSDRFDLLLLDLTMPVMDGLETLEAVRKSASHKDQPILLMSAHADEERVRRAVGLGILDVLVKPFSQEVLRDRVRRVLKLETIQTAAGPVTRRALDLPPRPDIVVVDRSAEFSGMAAGVLARLGPVACFENEFEALSRCLSSPPALVVVGTTSDLTSPALLARKIRAAGDGVPPRLVAAAARGEAADVGPHFDAVIVRSFDGATFEAGLRTVLGATTRARYLLHPESPEVRTVVAGLAEDASTLFGEPVTLEDADDEVLPEARWLVCTVEIQAGHLAWEFRVLVPQALARACLEAAAGVAADRVSDEEIAQAVGGLVGRASARLQAALAPLGTTLDLLPPRARLTTAMPLRLHRHDPDLPGGCHWRLGTSRGSIALCLAAFGAPIAEPAPQEVR